MNYKAATYLEKQEFERTLTTAQRTKIRKLEKQFKEQIQPINWASHAKEEEVRRQAWQDLKISERVNELTLANAPRIAELTEQIKTLQEELHKLQESVSDQRSTIQTEPYAVAMNDPEVKAMRAIWRKTQEIQEQKLQDLIDSFTQEA